MTIPHKSPATHLGGNGRPGGESVLGSLDGGENLVLGQVGDGAEDLTGSRVCVSAVCSLVSGENWLPLLL